MDAKKFDLEHFDFEKCLQESMREIKKPNILVCGGTGVGKSSLINDIFNMPEEYGAAIGKNSRPETRGIHAYCSEGQSVNLFDSEGYEITGVDDTNNSRFYKEVLAEIDRRAKENEGERIHEVWYCISAGNKRFYPIDEKLIQMIQNKNIPVLVILTKVDLVDQQELDALLKEILHSTSCNCYTYSLELKDDPALQDKYVQKDEIIKWAMDHLEESMRISLIPAIKLNLQEQCNNVIKEVVPFYSSLAAAAVVGTSFSPIPLSDSIPLMGIQIKMASSIIHSFNIRTDTAKVVTGVVGTNLISYIGKTIATQILGVIPIFGTIVKNVVNASVATTVTAVLGTGISLLCKQYLEECVKRGGVENLPFMEYFTADRLTDIIKYVNDNMANFHLDQMIAKTKNDSKK